ncbi:DNase I-like protein, partial [Leucogyrophana mollusca]
RTRANITIATLNVRGRASSTLGTDQLSKWTEIHQTVRDKKIGILCLQETHLMDPHEQQIDNLFSRRIKLINSQDPDRPGNSAGVAFVLNREITTPEDAIHTTIIPGRALAVSLKWHNDQTITILNVYAPNNPSEHQPFWERIRHTCDTHNIHPDFLLGDFNLTEEAIDRAPARLDNEPARDALRDLRLQMNIQDGWRHTFPTDRSFTYCSNNNTMSRLDRIYSTLNTTPHLSCWNMSQTSIPTDHKMVSVRYALSDAPLIGKGRWSWPIGLLNDEPLLTAIEALGMPLQESLSAPRTQRTARLNPQTLWEEFKTQITDVAKKTAKAHLGRINRRIKQLQRDLTLTNNRQDIDSDVSARSRALMLESEIDHLTKKGYKSAQVKAQAQWNLKGESVSKYWSRVN